tara:strand:+ start:2124 stop:2381 length:258 start_codon:yes stop_codon:yes gene_type:complete
MIEVIDELFSEIILAITLGGGGLLIGFFRKLYKTQSELCLKITTLQSALLILSAAIDNQTLRYHGSKEGEGDLADLVRRLIDKKE